MSEPKASRGEVGGTAMCALDVQLPRSVAPRGAKSQLDCLNLDQSGLLIQTSKYITLYFNEIPFFSCRI